MTKYVVGWDIEKFSLPVTSPASKREALREAKEVRKHPANVGGKQKICVYRLVKVKEF